MLDIKLLKTLYMLRKRSFPTMITDKEVNIRIVDELAERKYLKIESDASSLNVAGRVISLTHKGENVTKELLILVGTYLIKFFVWIIPIALSIIALLN